VVFSLLYLTCLPQQRAPEAPQPCANCNRRQEQCLRNPDQACNAYKHWKVGCSLAKASVQKPVTSDTEMGKAGGGPGPLAWAPAIPNRNPPGELATSRPKLKILEVRKQSLEDRRAMLLQEIYKIREQVHELGVAGR